MELESQEQEGTTNDLNLNTIGVWDDSTVVAPTKTAFFDPRRPSVDGTLFIFQYRDNDRIFSKCVFCNGIYSSGVRTDGNLKSHIKAKHPEHLEEYVTHVHGGLRRKRKSEGIAFAKTNFPENSSVGGLQAKIVNQIVHTSGALKRKSKGSDDGEKQRSSVSNTDYDSGLTGSVKAELDDDNLSSDFSDGPSVSDKRSPHRVGSGQVSTNMAKVRSNAGKQYRHMKEKIVTDFLREVYPQTGEKDRRTMFAVLEAIAESVEDRRS